MSFDRSSSKTSQIVRSGRSGWPCALAQAKHLSSSQAFNSSKFLNRSLGVKKRSRTKPTWFSTCPFSQPEAGVQATGSTRWCEHICRKRRLYCRSLNEDRLHRRLHVVVDAAPTGALEECERSGRARRTPSPVSRADRRARTSSGCGKAGHARPSRSSSPRPFNDVVAPIELVGLARRERQRHKGIHPSRSRASRDRRSHSGGQQRSCPQSRGRIAPRITEDERQPLTGRRYSRSPPRFKPVSPRTNPGKRLPGTFVMELGGVRAE